MTNKISHTKVSVYNECSKKYFYKYVEYLYKDEVPTPLLFGIALDEALNYILLCKKNNEAINNKSVVDVFTTYLSNYNGEYIKDSPKVQYTGGDIDYYLLTPEDITMMMDYDPHFENVVGLSQAKQREYTKRLKQESIEYYNKLGWKSLYNKGLLMLDTYIHEILPKFKRIIDVQIHYIIPNGEGDELIVKMDFVAELHDGRIVVFDNKSTSKPYPDDSVQTSPQLATYLEFYATTWAGYITLDKSIRKDKQIRWQFIVDKIPEDFSKRVFDNLTDSLYSMKMGIYEKNENACFSFGRKCDYWDLCKKGSFDGLYKREKKG